MHDPNDGTNTSSIADTGRVRSLLIDVAMARRPTSYAELLGMLGHRFSRPKMRAVCKTLDTIDEAARAAGEPALAVLVVRESDGLPGQGWWVGNALSLGYDGPWTGHVARNFVTHQQAKAFDHWAAHAPHPSPPLRDRH